LLHDSRRTATNLRGDDDDDGLAYCYVSSWFKTYRTTLNLLEKTSSLDDIVLEDETTQTSESRAIDEIGSSARHHSRHK